MRIYYLNFLTMIAKKHFITLVLLSIVLFSFTLKDKTYTSANLDKLWEEVYDFEKKELPKSALKVVDVIYEIAKKEQLNDEMIKAVIHHIKYNNSIKPDALVDEIHYVQKEFDFFNLEGKAILNSMIAETYLKYFHNHRWKIMSRTEVVKEEHIDISNWSYSKFIKEISYYYAKSLENKEALQQVSVKEYGIILEKGSAQKERPTLYDFLLNRALDYFENHASNLDVLNTTFLLNEKAAFLNAKSFVNFDFSSNKQDHPFSKVVLLYQDWLKLRLSDSLNTTAFFYADLSRLNFVRLNSTRTDGDELYLAALNTMLEDYESSYFQSEIKFLFAKYYNEKSNYFRQGTPESYGYRNYSKIAYDYCIEILEQKTDEDIVDGVERMKNQIEKSKLHFVAEDKVYPKQTIPVLLNFKNLEKVFVRVYNLSFSEIEKKNRVYNRQMKYKELIAGKEPVKTTVFELPKVDNFIEYCTELLLDPLPIGYYILALSNGKTFDSETEIVSYSVLQSTKLAYLQRKTNAGSVSYFITDRKTGNPLERVAAQVVYKNYDYRSRSQMVKMGKMHYSDSEGKLSINHENQSSNQGFILQLTVKGDTLETGSSYTYEVQQRKAETKIHLFTDRAIYRPGQTVYFKGLVTETVRGTIPEIVKNYQTKISFKDVHWKEVAKQNVTTNEYGTFSGLFIIPEGSLNGRMKLQTPFGNISIQVEEYKRPTFEVTLNKSVDQIKLEENVAVTGKALMYNGMALQGAKVSYKVTRMPSYYRWWMPTSRMTQIDYGEVSTNKQGEFSIDFMALSGKSNTKPNDSFTFSVEVDVIDASGETRSAQTAIYVGGVALSIKASINEIISKQNPENWIISLINSQEESVSANVNILVTQLITPDKPFIARKFNKPDTLMYSEVEYNEKFSGFKYGNSDYLKGLKESGKIVYEKNQFVTGSKKIIPENIEKWESGIYKVKVNATDAFGEDISKVLYFTLYSETSKRTPYPIVNWFINKPMNLQPGDVAELFFGSSEKIKVLYQVEYNNQIIHEENIKIKNKILKFSYPVSEDLRGGFAMHFTFVYENRIYENHQVIKVPYTNKELQVTYETFRDKLKPGEPEEWLIKLKGPKGETVVTEMLAGMYDASLDEYAPNNWNISLYPEYFYQNLWDAYAFGYDRSNDLYPRSKSFSQIKTKTYDRLNWFNAFGYYPGLVIRGASSAMKSYSGDQKELMSAISVSENFLAEEEGIADEEVFYMKENSDYPDQADDDMKIREDKMPVEVKMRSNFNETAFFYPNVYSDSLGNTVIKFTMPESLTQWKFQAFAHSQNLEYALTSKTIVTQKELMAEINAPRFITQGDTIILPAKIQNLTDSVMSGEVTLSLENPLTGSSYMNLILDEVDQAFMVDGKETVIKRWKVFIPDTLTSLQYKVIAKAGNYSDGEQKWIPVLSNKVLVTESKSLWINGTETRNFTLEGLKESDKSSTLKHHKLTLEYTSNPTWYAIQALPFLIEQESKCTEQIFESFYANSLSEWIIDKNPLLRNTFEQWRNEKTSRPFLSNLEQNQELKQVLLKETPWLLDALSENEQRQRLAVLFDVNQMASRKQQSIYKLQLMQYPNGSWPWFDGMQESRFVTQFITTGIGKLIHLGAITEDDKELMQMVNRSVRYLDGKLLEQYTNYLNSRTETNLEPKLSVLNAQYLYMRSFFSEMGIPTESKIAYDHYDDLAKKQWQKLDKYSQGLLALHFYRSNDKQIAFAILKSLKEYSLISEELGMYWKENVSGYNWYQAPVEFQSLMIEVFTELEDNLQDENELKKWLLKNKQTNNWKTTKATANAIYALLYSGSNWVSTKPDFEISLGEGKIRSSEIRKSSELATGYFKKSWNSAEINSKQANIKVTRKGEGISWGGVYWQYFEQIDNVKSSASGLKVNKQLFKEVFSETGNVLEPISGAELHVGDRLVVRIDFSVDRKMEYVHLKDNRASAFEPIDIFSGYSYKGGLGFYQTTHDTSTDFFIEYLPAGNYTVEYRLNVTHAGTFSSGLSTLQCMYAPEFNAHSKGEKVTIK